MTAPRFRTASPAEIAMMLDWAAREGWNPGLDDAQAFQVADPDGFFVADLGGRPVAAISVVNHSDQFAFLGLYLCLPQYRGKGIGLGLWTHALRHAGGRVVGLDGVPAQQENYVRSGFQPARQTRRFEGHLPPEDLVLPVAQPGDFETLIALDTAANGVERARFLSEWLHPRPTRKTVLLHDAAQVTGFATARLCREGCKIGPIIAPGPEAALTLARQAAAAVKHDRVIIDVPDGRPALAQRLHDLGFAQSFNTARMFRGPALTAGPDLQAVATLELG